MRRLTGKRETEGQARSNLIDRMPIGDGVAYPDIEAQIIPNTPNQANEARYRFLLAELILIEKLRDLPNRPRIRPFEDGAKEHIAMMISRECGLSVEMDRSPIPALRDDAG